MLLLSGRAALLGCIVVFVHSGRAQSGTASVNHAPEISGVIEGSVHVMQPEDIAVDGRASIGTLLVPGSPTVRINGRPSYGGVTVGGGAAEPANHRVLIGGAARVSQLRTRVDMKPAPSPVVTQLPTGFRSVMLSTSAQEVGDFSTVRHLTVTGAGGSVAVPPGAYGAFAANGSRGFTLGVEGSTRPVAYSFERLSLNGQTELHVISPVVLTLGGEVIVNSAVGSAEHPHWLQIRFPSDGLVLNGGARVFANVVSPLGSLVLRGGSQFVGGVSSNRLIVEGNALLRLVNQPPVVSLVDPTAGTSMVSKPVPLVATASDQDGTVAKVEFYVDGTKTGEAVEPPFSIMWAPSVGVYLLEAKAYDDLGAVSFADSISVRVVPELPYATDFEEAEGFRLNALDGQGAWAVESGKVTIISSESFSGDWSVLLKARKPPSRVMQNFARDPDEAVVFTDFFVMPVADAELESSTIVETEVTRVAFQRTGSHGTFYCLDGDGEGGGRWHATSAVHTLDSDGRVANWTRVTLREDHLQKRWDLYVNGVLIAADLRFRKDIPTPFPEFSISGHSSEDTFFDSFYAGFENPIFIDADRDGIDDDWERANGMSPAMNDRATDLDGDGISNLQEYVNGTDPRDYYNGVSPVLTSLLGQAGFAGENGLVAVRVTTAEGGILKNAPVAFELGSSVAQIGLFVGGPTVQQLTARTDAEGIARVYIKFVSYASAELSVRARERVLPILVRPPITDDDDDGLPDLWEITYFGNRDGDSSGDWDGDGLTDGEEFQRGSSPIDYYNGVLPQMSALADDGSGGAEGIIRLKVSSASGDPLSNAPVTFAVEEGGHKLAESPGGVPFDQLVVRTDQAGVAKVYIVNGGDAE